MVEGRNVKEERLQLIDFVSRELRVYPTIVEGIPNLISTSTGLGNELLRRQELSKCWSFIVEQRGYKYIIARGSSIRNTHGYETLTYHLLSYDTPSNVEDNPTITISLILRDLQDSLLLKPH